MGLFGALAGVFGGGAQKKAARAAAEQQTLALNRAIDIQNNQFQQTRTDFMPYTRAGSNAITSLDELMRLATGGSYGGAGTPPYAATDQMLDAQNQLEDRLKASPLYQTLYRNGEEALLQNSAATGGLRGGNAQRSLADFSADTLSNVYSTIKSDLGSLAGLGLGATGSVAGFGANAANATSGFATDIGNAQANKQLAIGRINAQNWSNIGSFLDDAVKAALPTGMLGQSSAAVSRLNPAARSVISSNSKIF